MGDVQSLRLAVYRNCYHNISTMKINKTYQVELSIEDCQRCLHNYQFDAIWELVQQMQKEELLTSVSDVTNFALGLLKGQHSKEFEELVEKYNVYWIDTPTFNSGWGKLVEQHPSVFELDPLIKQFVDDQHGETKLQVNVDGQPVDNVAMLANY